MKINVHFFHCTAMLLISINIRAQAQPREYDNEFIGWKKIYRFAEREKELRVDNRVYSPAQLTICDTLISWMQASYTPKGGLGYAVRTVLPKITDFTHYRAAMPQSYGAYAGTYFLLKKKDGKWTNETTDRISWEITANGVSDELYQLRDMTTTSGYYLCLPAIDADALRNPNSSDYHVAQTYDLSKYPVIGKYINLNLPKGGQPVRRNVVILSRNNRDPFIRIRNSEFFTSMTAILQQKYTEEKAENLDNHRGDQSGLALLNENTEKKFRQAIATLSAMKEKYRDKGNDDTYISGGHFSIQELANGEDVFTGEKVGDPGNISHAYPLLKVDPELQSHCREDRPQWVLISWYGLDVADPVFKHMHESIVNNFNFDYVYNYFFAPEKIKGIPYKPNHNPGKPGGMH